MTPNSAQDLVDALIRFRENEYVRFTAHWMTYDATALDEEPALTGDQVIDALIAAATEAVALRRGQVPPAWTKNPARRLTDWWQPGPPGLRQGCIDHSLPPFHRRMLAVEENSLRCV